MGFFLLSIPDQSHPSTSFGPCGRPFQFINMQEECAKSGPGSLSDYDHIQYTPLCQKYIFSGNNTGFRGKERILNTAFKFEGRSGCRYIYIWYKW